MPFYGNDIIETFWKNNENADAYQSLLMNVLLLTDKHSEVSLY